MHQLARPRTVWLLVALTAAVACGYAAGTARWAGVALIAAAGVWVIGSRGRHPAEAGLITVSAFLPLFNLGWLASLRSGVGLLTVILGATCVCALPLLVRNARALVRARSVQLILLFALIVAASLVLADRGADSTSIAKTLIARATLLPLVIIVVVTAFGRLHAFRFVAEIRTLVIGIGVAGSLLSILQITANVGYFAPSGVAGIPIDQFVGNRAIGLSEHPGTWAAFLLIPLCLAGAEWLRTSAPLMAAITFLLAFSMIVTGLRSGWIALALVLVLGLLTARSWWIRGLAVAFVVCGAAIALQLSTFQTFVGQGRIGEDESAQERVTLTHAELVLGLREPLTGIGLGNLGPAMTTIHAKWLRDQHLIFPGVPIDRHNTYAGTFAELGIPGLAVFLAVLGYGFWALVGALRRTGDAVERSLLRGLTAALAGTVVVAAFTDADRQIFMWWILGFAFALAAVVRHDDPEPAPA
jgi:O-antigen ligase